MNETVDIFVEHFGKGGSYVRFIAWQTVAYLTIFVYCTGGTSFQIYLPLVLN